MSDNASLDKILDGTTLTISSSPTKKHLVASMPVLGSARVPADKVFRLQYTINMIVSYFMFSRSIFDLSSSAGRQENTFFHPGIFFNFFIHHNAIVLILHIPSH